MTLRSVGPVLRHVRAVCAAAGTASLSDEQLLQRFVSSREEPAFRALLLRHGPLVWGVCRRLLRDGDAAEDAFQATFVTLARKADAIRKQTSVGSWLYGVAFRLASRARTTAARQPAPSTNLDTLPDPYDGEADISLREAQAVLDQELGRLPEKVRAPLVLCYLEGKTRDEAAQQLGCPLSTFKHRLEDGRRLLRRALERRGVALAMVLAASALTAKPVPAALADLTARAALSGASPAALSSAGLVGVILAHASKFKMAGALLLSAGVLVLVAGQANHGSALAAAENAPAAAAPASPPEAAKQATDLVGDPLPPEALARMGTLRWRHPGLSYLAVLPGDRGVITASRDGGLRLWDGKDGKEVRRFERPKDDGLKAELPKPDEDPTSRAKMEMMMRRMMGGDGTARDLTEPTVSADGKVLAQVVPGGRAYLWDVATGKFLRAVAVSGAASEFPPALNRDGSLLAVTTDKNQVAVYDTTTGEEKQRLGEERNGREATAANGGQLVFSPDGKCLVSTSFISAAKKARETHFEGRSFDLATGKQLETFEGPGKVFALTALSPDGSKMAWAGPKGQDLHICDTASGKDVGKIEEKELRGGVLNIAFSPNGSKIAVRNRDGGLGVWETATGNRLARYPGVERGGKFTIVIAGTNLVNGTTLAFSADGQSIFGIADDGNAIQRWDLDKERRDEHTIGHLGQVTALTIADGGKALITLGQDDTLRRWSPETGKEMDRFPLPGVSTTLAFSPDGNRCAYVSNNMALVRAVNSTRKPTRLEGDEGVSDLVFSPDGKTIVGRSEQSLIVWESETGKFVRRIRMVDAPPDDVARGFFKVRLGQPRAEPRALAMSSDGRTVACVPTASAGGNFAFTFGKGPAEIAATEEDRTITLWDMVRGKRIGKFDGPKGGATATLFSPDGRLLAVAGNDHSLTLSEVVSGQVRARIQVEEGDGNAAALAFSPDGRILAAGYPDRSIRFWDVDTGKPLGRLTGHQGRITALTFSPDGQTLFSASSDTTALAWSMKSIRKAEAPPATDLNPEALAAAWKSLADTDAQKASDAVRSLIGSGGTVAFLANRSKPVASADPAVVARLLTELEDRSFETRQAAEDQLTKLSDLAITGLEKALAGSPSLESRKRLEHVLDAIVTEEQPRPEMLQALRSIEVLERIGSPEARELLQKLASGDEAARPTRAAKAALDRSASRLARSQD
jgi:RNA polymerase sigma factor (sigma-70 family)